jgi:hypothetical protein
MLKGAAAADSDRLFRSHGLPEALRTDNGSPFANRTGLGGLVQLSVCC